MNDIGLRLKKIIMKNSRKEISESDITDNSSLTADFGFDSVQMIEMIIDIESEFDITIEDEDIELDVLTKYGLLKGLISKKVNADCGCEK